MLPSVRVRTLPLDGRRSSVVRAWRARTEFPRAKGGEGEQLHQADYEYNKKENAAKAVSTLVHSVIWLGDPELADEAATFLIKIPRLEDHNPHIHQHQLCGIGVEEVDGDNEDEGDEGDEGDKREEGEVETHDTTTSLPKGKANGSG